MRLGFSNEWLRDKIASDPDVECEAGFAMELKPMSYSFTVTASTKLEAREKIKAELDKVVEVQPTHAADRLRAQEAADAFIDLLKEPGASDCITVSVSGSLSWNEHDRFTSANVNVGASVRPKS